MRTTLSLLGALALCLASTAAVRTVRAQDGPPAAELLASSMKQIETSMKILRRSVRDAGQRQASLTELEALQVAALDARRLLPPMGKELVGAEREALQLAYRRTLTVFAQRALELELAVIDGDVDASQKLWNALSELEDEGHGKFAPGD